MKIPNENIVLNAQSFAVTVENMIDFPSAQFIVVYFLKKNVRRDTVSHFSEIELHLTLSLIHSKCSLAGSVFGKRSRSVFRLFGCREPELDRSQSRDEKKNVLTVNYSTG